MASLALGPRRCRGLASITAEHLSGTAASSSSKSLDDESDLPSVHGFLVGTTVLVGENDLLTLQYEEDEKKLSQLDTRLHSAGEIWEIAPHPKHKMVIACWGSSTAEARGMSLISEDLYVSNIEGSAGARNVAFNNKSGGDKLASVHEDGMVKVWGFHEGDLTPVVSNAFPSNLRAKGTKDIAWDPNHPDLLIGALGGSTASIIDCRERQVVSAIETGTRCLTIDANPNRPHFFLSGGEDSLVKIWDNRKAEAPVQILRGGHQHWVSRARYNPFHDQLIISSSTDGSVCLCRATSVSSAPLLDMESDDEDEVRMETKKQQQDGLVKSYDENLDSVYGLAWSSVSAWVFASLAYDGKLVVHTVPASEKYKILL